MKIIKRPEIPGVVCKSCGCEFQPKYRDIRINGFTLRRNEIRCPICYTRQQIKYIKPKDTKDTSALELTEEINERLD